MDPSVQKKVTYWLTGPFDLTTKKEVEELQKNPSALADAFFSDLSFGTGGLRALMGVGTSRLNVYTIRKATQGVANYLKKHSSSPSVVIAFDSRHHSEEFAKEASCTLAGNGITVYLIPELRPTPYLSFACRYKQATSAIMITASHNPKEYNGYKVYGSDGAQVVSPQDEEIMKEMDLVDFSSINLAPITDPLIHTLSLPDLDQAYLKAIKPLQTDQPDKDSLQIIYTSLHGTGITMIPQALSSWGFSSVHFVEKQVIVDGNFSTAPSPNPEDPKAMHLAMLELAERQADIAIASDPDADRIGVAILHKGKPILLTGNEIAAICTHFLASQPHPKNSAVITTIVTTELLKKICKQAKIKLVEVLTGFKYIGEKILEWEQNPPSPHFLFGAEESYGYLIGTHARDKDGIVSSCLIAEIALAAKKQGKTLLDALYALYEEYGVFREKQASLNFSPGMEGMQTMQRVMKALRTKPPIQIHGQEVIYIEDYQTGFKTDLRTSIQEPLTLPSSDVLTFRLKDHSRLVIRPSGTEPKLKIYAGVESSHFSSAQEGIQECDKRLNDLLKNLKELCNL